MSRHLESIPDWESLARDAQQKAAELARISHCLRRQLELSKRRATRQRLGLRMGPRAKRWECAALSPLSRDGTCPITQKVSDESLGGSAVTSYCHYLHVGQLPVRHPSMACEYCE